MSKSGQELPCPSPCGLRQHSQVIFKNLEKAKQMPFSGCRAEFDYTLSYALFDGAAYDVY